jgi:hypothetical protein
MRYPFRSGSVAGLMVGVAAAFVLALGTLSAKADDAFKTAKPSTVHAAKVLGATGKKRVPHRYFIEFRARNAATYGHMYVMYGLVNSRDEVVKSHIAGFFPAGDKRNCINCSVVNWTIGHVVFVPGEMGASDGDLEEKYVLARFRVWVTRKEYDRVVAYIKKTEAHPPMWNALWKNCVDFGRDVAEYMHLKVPFFIWLEPKDFVTALREDNGVKHEQLPLKDASSHGYAMKKPPLPPRPPKSDKSELPGTAAQPSAAVEPAASAPGKQEAASEPAPSNPDKQPAAVKPAPKPHAKKQAAAQPQPSAETVASSKIMH